MRKKMVRDLAYGIGAIGIMNIVLQFVVYPLVNRLVGSAGFGEMLFWLGIISILAPSFGLAVNNTRLVFHKREETENGDYFYLVCLFAIISMFIVGGIGIVQETSVLSIVILLYIVGVSVFRNYSTVEYRLRLNYSKQFLFYVILSVGYIVGILGCRITKDWSWIFIVGETIAMLYVIYTGCIYQKKLKISKYFRQIGKQSFLLAGAYLITNLMLNLDRIVLKYSVGDEAVSQYYVLSLLGKTVALIGGPLSSVIISYISKNHYQLRRTEFMKIISGMLAGGALFLLGAVVATPIYIKLLYPNLYGSTIGLNIIINAAQVLYFLTTILLVIILTYCESKWQLIIQIVYSVSFLISAMILTNIYGLEGFAVAAIFANGLYFVLTGIVGFWFVKK